MRSQNSILVFGLYLTVAVVVILIGRLSYQWMQPSGLTATGDVRVGVKAQVPPPARSAAPSRARSRSNERLDQLRRTLDESTRLLHERTASLRARDAECRRLQEELDDSIAFVFSLLAVARGESVVLEEESAAGLEQRMKSLRDELRDSAELRAAQATQLDELRTALLETEVEIAEIRMAAEQEYTALISEREVVETAAGDALVALGALAVPVMSELLADPRAEVRAWSAAVLARIGAPAAAATPLLVELLTDDDERVRVAAQAALVAIEA